MKGVLILAHGSREKATEETLNYIVAQLKAQLPEQMIQSAYLQFSEKDLSWGLNTLADAGAKEIVVVPYFLFSGVHICEDIPEEIKNYCKKRPGLEIRMGKTLGTDHRLAEILADRVREAV